MSKNFNVERIGIIPISGQTLTRVYKSNHIVEAVTVAKTNSGIHNYKKVGKNCCLNLVTNELIMYSKEKSKVKTQNHFKKSANILRRIINLNFTGEKSEKFLTLTYGYPMTDYKTALGDFKKFWSLFKYRFPDCEYIRVAEPQENGTWHLHILIKDMKANNLFVGIDMLRKIWGKGWVWIEDLPFADNFGAYFSVRFSTIENSEKTEIIQKGSRIKFYPPDFKFYTCSKGIKKPKAIQMSHDELMEMVDNAPPCYGYTNVISDSEGRPLNNITYEQFNLKNKGAKK